MFERKYTDPEVVRFVQDMEEAGLEVSHYQGRYFWQGPAVSCANIQDVLSETKVPCQWDNLGKGWIVYPKASDVGEAV